MLKKGKALVSLKRKHLKMNNRSECFENGFDLGARPQIIKSAFFINLANKDKQI